MKFMKIMSVVASAVLLGSTALVGAAYPAPFVTNGLAGGAIVVGANAAASDMAAAIDLQTSLGTGLISSEETSETNSDDNETSTDFTLEGENYPLFTGSSQLYLGSSLKDVREILNSKQLPSILAKGEFEGNVESDYTLRIEMGENAKIVYAQQPDDDEEPVIGVSLASCDKSNPIYTSVVKFNKEVNFADVDSKGEEITLFGQKYTVGVETNTDELVLYKSSETIDLSIGGDSETSATVSVGGADYIIKLISADADEAVIKVTDAEGNSDSKELDEDESKNINGLDIALKMAHVSEALGREMVEITIGAEKVILKDGNKVKVGPDEDSVKGTEVSFEGADVDAIRTIKIKVWESDDEEDAILEGESFTDPVFNTFGITFLGMSSADDTEEIFIGPSDDDTMEMTMVNHQGNEQTFDWYKAGVLADDDGDEIHVAEMQSLLEDDSVVIGNEDEGYLLELTNLDIDGDDFSDSEITFKNVFDSDEEFEVEIDEIDNSYLDVDGNQYDLIIAEDNNSIQLDYPDSGENTVLLYPTIQTSEGAQLGFYTPISISNETGVTTARIPDGDGYTNVNITSNATVSVGTLTYNVTVIDGISTITLLGVYNPAVVLFEGEDDVDDRNTLIVTIDGSEDVEVDKVIMTGANSGELESEDDDDISTVMDLWGTLVTIDDTDEREITIVYPDEQAYAEAYLAEGEATTTTTSTTITPDTNEILVVKDSEVDSVKDRNLIVVGGSCINTVAAKILGGSFCGEEFTDATGVGAGLYLTKVVASPYNAEKIAMLVAGYEAADTTAAVTEVIGGAISTELTV